MIALFSLSCRPKSTLSKIDESQFGLELKRQDRLADLGYWLMVDFVILDSTYHKGEKLTSIPIFGIKTTNISNMELEVTGATCSNAGACEISIGRYCLGVYKENEPRIPPGDERLWSSGFKCVGRAQFDYPCIVSTGELARENVCLPRRRPGMLGISIMGDTLRYVTNNPLDPGIYWLHVSTSNLNPLTSIMYRVDYENPSRIHHDSLIFTISNSHE